MQRFDYLKTVAADAQDALAVSTGWGSREWWAVRPSDGNLKTRTLGLVSSIAAGLAIALPHRKVIAIDGDGAFLMNLCGLPTIARQSPGNLLHLLFDNEIYEASGGTATAIAQHRCGGHSQGRGLPSRPVGRLTGSVSQCVPARLGAQRADLDRGESRSRPAEKFTTAKTRRDREQIPLHALLGGEREQRHSESGIRLEIIIGG